MSDTPDQPQPADNALQHQLNEARFLLASIDTALARIEFDPDGTIRYANPIFCTGMGYRLEDLVGKHHRLFMFPEDVNTPEYSEHWQRLSNGEALIGEIRRKKADGQAIHLQASYAPVLNSKGEVYRVVKCAFDISDRVDAVHMIGRGLRRMADANLSEPVEDYPSATFKSLRVDFNDAQERLGRTLRDVTDRTSEIDAGTQQMAVSTASLAHHAENQKTALKETSASVQTVANMVSQTSAGAEQALDMVRKTKDCATQGLEVMSSAQNAMDEIAQGASEISKITSVIDQISFQTNLLALNAGVEAARAGDAGRGFAVVASEVRALAQRSSEAATQIADLITASGQQVQAGVELVSRTGDSLQEIGKFVGDALEQVSEIAKGASTQSDDLRSIADSVRVVDELADQNAELCTQVNAESSSLRDQVERLTETAGTFQISHQPSASPLLRAAG